VSKVARAILSVSDKTGLTELARALGRAGVEMLASGGTARALAAAGVAVLQMDRLGCGDSAGDSGDADWATWVQDVLDACALARERLAELTADADTLPLWLWGLRSGCLLAVEAAAHLPQASAPLNLLLWQPVLQGKTVLQQFLRLDSVASRLGKAAPAGSLSAQHRLAAGETVLVAGYEITPVLARGMELARLQPQPRVRRVHWLDIRTQADAPVAPATLQALQAWTQAGVSTQFATVVGPAFWQTTEIEDAPALQEATCRAIVEGMSP